MSEISELMDVGDSLTTLKSPLSTTDEFFDAVDDGKIYMFIKSKFCY